MLFNLLESPHIKDKIKNIISHLIEEDNKLKEITFVGLYLCMHDIDIDFHLISQLSSDEIYSYYIKNNSNFNQIFNIKDNKFISKSSIFCQKVIINFIEPEYTIKTLLSIADKINLLNRYHHNFVNDDLLKSCFKFSTLERILPEANKAQNIIIYYEKLKRTIPWLIHDPLFWL